MIAWFFNTGLWRSWKSARDLGFTALKGCGFGSWYCRNYAQKMKIFFLIIEDEDYSKSRTKIGLSVDK